MTIHSMTDEMTSLLTADHFVIDKRSGKFELTAIGGRMSGKTVLSGADKASEIGEWCKSNGISDVRNRS